jgi:hypothetical protein
MTFQNIQDSFPLVRYQVGKIHLLTPQLSINVRAIRDRWPFCTFRCLIRLLCASWGYGLLVLCFIGRGFHTLKRGIVRIIHKGNDPLWMRKGVPQNHPFWNFTFPGGKY